MNDWIEHLDELRRCIIYILLVFMVAVACIFAFSPRIVDFLRAPIAHMDVKLYTFAPAEKIMTHLHLSVWAAVVATLPFFLIQLGLFIWPALKKGERRYSLFALIVVPFLFLGGAALAYRLFSPVVLGFFLTFGAGDGVGSLWSLGSYIGLLSSMMLGFGLLLQASLLLLLAFAIGIVTPKQVARGRSYVILLIFFLAALCTPPDVISQIMLGIPLYLLFELTVFAGRFFKHRDREPESVSPKIKDESMFANRYSDTEEL